MVSLVSFYAFPVKHSRITLFSQRHV